MNKTLKIILIILNLAILIIALCWFMHHSEPHPLIIMIGQGAILIGLLFEKKISGIITKNVSDSKIKVNAKQGSNIHTSDIKNSEIDIKNR